MLRPLINQLVQELSPQNCLDHIQMISRHHRIQASPGYRAAARECLQVFRDSGLAAKITAYPATGTHREWHHLTPREWNCRDAELWLTDAEGRRTERLAWYQAVNLSVIQRSASTSPDGVMAELAVIENAETADAWEHGDLKGKVALVGNGDIHRMWSHAQRAGVIGLITSRMTYQPPVRPVGDLADALQYTSFWWSEGEPQGWGFVLSTRQGDRLKQMAARGPVRLFARVDAESYDGTIENVEAVIPGATAEEVLVVAHLCHPKPSANDNASGPATLMETARALAAMIRDGRLPAPRRSIRFLLVPEMTGTYAHLAALSAADRARVVAAVNADMVGQKQEVTGSTLLCEYPPVALPSFAGDLMALVMGEVAQEMPPLSGMGRRYGLFRHAAVAFSGGSDHYILSDPSVGIPCPMLIQWPDRFYHTSEDTLDKSDPAMMGRVGQMLGAYAYFLANAGKDEAIWLATEMAHLFGSQLHEAFEQSLDPEAVTNFRVERKVADLGSLQRLVNTADWASMQPALQVCQRQIHSAATMEVERRALSDHPVPAPSAAGPAVVSGWNGAADLTAIHPVRTRPGPISLRNDLPLIIEADSWRKFDALHPGSSRVADYLCFWADGNRSLAEICRLTHLETGVHDPVWALGYFQLLKRLGWATGL